MSKNLVSRIANPETSLPDDVILRVDNVSKKFCRNLKQSMKYGIRDLALGMIGWKSPVPELSSVRGSDADRRPEGGREMRDTGGGCSNHESRISNQPTDDGLRPAEFWAVKDVSFDLKRGECLGLIGRNGCGKTTLLRLLAGIFPPDRGSISVRGRVGALISLGAGFHPHMTGRENIYLNGAILGLSKKEITAQFDEIIDFAEIGEFIDAPVSAYSSGMRVRLGFAVATAIRPDLLLLDEILAVGDAAFRAKCYNRIATIKYKAGVVFVSHTMDQISQFCDRVLVLSSGLSHYLGAVKDGIEGYEKLHDESSVEVDKYFVRTTEPVIDAKVTVQESQVAYGGKFWLTIHLTCRQEVFNALLKVVLYDSHQHAFAQWASEYSSDTLDLHPGENNLHVCLGPLFLRAGKYRLGVVLNGNDRISMLLWSYKMLSVTVNSEVVAGPVMVLQAMPFS